MAKTGENVFLRAIKLLDGMERDGTINESKITSYRSLAPTILTMLQGELLPVSTADTDVTSLSDNLSVSDKQALYVLPYGLAAELMISQDDDQTIAAYFSQRYETMKRRFPTPATIIDIVDVYGVASDPSGG